MTHSTLPTPTTETAPRSRLTGLQLYALRQGLRNDGVRPQQELSTPQPLRRWLPPGLLVLTGVLIFCHGCHADTDDELAIGWVKSDKDGSEEK